jgi:hypothetical protein
VANYKEVALGIASAIASEHSPDPLPLLLKGQELPEAAKIVLTVIDECEQAGIRLARVDMDRELYSEVQSHLPPSVRATSNTDLRCEVRFFKSHRDH